MTRSSAWLAAALDDAGREARRDGSSAVEAHHLLLALASGGGPDTVRILRAAGLDYPGLREAFARESGRSLEAAGVSLAEGAAPHPSHGREGSPPLGSSVRLAIERGVEAGGKQNLRPEHLLLGIVQAPVGTVPRALALVGVDPSSLAQTILRGLADDDGAEERR